MRNKRLLILVVAVAAILLTLWLAMQFTDQVNWTPFDFIVAGVLMLSAGLAYEFFARRQTSVVYRVIACVAIAAVLILVWLELAVGIFGTPWAGS